MNQRYQVGPVGIFRKSKYLITRHYKKSNMIFLLKESYIIIIVYSPEAGTFQYFFFLQQVYDPMFD